jgi:hypothetical protein
MEINGERIFLTVGQDLAIPRGRRPPFRNHSDESVRFPVIAQPPSHGDWVNAFVSGATVCVSQARLRLSRTGSGDSSRPGLAKWLYNFARAIVFR